MGGSFGNTGNNLSVPLRFGFAMLKDPIVALLLGVFAMAWMFKSSTPRRTLPPGPKAVPVIGNLLDWPTVRPWLVFDKWFKEYKSDILHFNLAGQHVIILGSRTASVDLLERRSAIYSDRPRLVTLADMMKWDFAFPFISYGAKWRQQRKLFNDHFNANAVRKYKPIQLREARILARRFLSTPEDFLHHIRHTFTAIIMDISYGIRISADKDPFVAVAETAMSSLSVAAIPGTTLTDIFPVIKYIPSWMPGASFQRYAEAAAKANYIMATKPWNAAKEALKNGTGSGSMAANLLENLPDEDRDAEEAVAMNSTATSYLGSSDTTVSTIQSLILAITMHPEIQVKAQAELDAVIGNRLPTFEDRDQLPYIQAIMKEASRWQPVSPMGNAHRAITDDYYNGYFIPKGTIVAANIWTILHDPKMYHLPFEFNPDRFIKHGKVNPDVLDPFHIAFGFGRRICPGRFLSDDSLFITVATLLMVFNFQPPLDEQGNPEKLEPEMSTGLISHCKPFKCRITPRSTLAESLIRDAELY